ncbi:MAG: hypothetical protein WCS94_21650 [Verrucomicrobiota bacterium]
MLGCDNEPMVCDYAPVPPSSVDNTCPWRQRIQGLLLGAAFALWGCEQFLPASPWLTLMDDLVIGIFVLDLGIIMASQLLKKE